MGERRRFLALILTMAAVVAVVTATVITILYNTAFEEERDRLRETAQSNARLMEAVARFDAIYSAGNVPGGAPAATLGQIREAHDHFIGFGRTGEFTLARREGDSIVFVLRHRHFDLAQPQPVPFSSAFAEPMRRALEGKSGTMVGLDYRGAMVLAAYEPVAVLDLGIVAKIDLAEVRAPFIKAGVLAGGIALALIIAGALTLRRIGEPMLRHIEDSERKYRKIFEGANDGMCVLSDVFEDCNEQLCRIWGCERKDIVGHPPLDFSPPTQPDGRTSREATREYLRTALTDEGKPFYWQHRRKDGVLIDTEVSLKTIEIGGRDLILAVVRDITERARMLHDLSAKNAQLEHYNKELAAAHTATLNMMADAQHAEEEREKLIAELQVKNAAMEQFNYTVSHELKTPLITIRGFLDLLRQDLAGGDRVRLDADMQHVSRAADTMRNLLDDLLNLSRLGWRLGLREPVALAETARDVMEGLAEKIADHAVQVTVATDLPVVRGDPGRLREVLQNLVENAVKFTGDQAAPRIDVGWRREKEEHVFFVSDNGMGVDPRFHDKVFGLFEHLDPNTEGTGVGLALVRRIVEAHGGRIWVESEGAGKGSTFCFTIPTGSSTA